jgi:uncharacterized protein DUF262
LEEDVTAQIEGELPEDVAELETEEDFSFPPAERKVVTQPVDLSVQTLLEQWESKLLFLPEIQREYVWDNGKASRLIESLLLNIPVPVLYFAETTDAKYEIIDGHQRVRSIVRYLKNEFSLSGLAVLREYKGLRFHKLPDREQRFLKMRTLRVVIISIDSHPNMKFEIFERLNTGAITLNAQELRNSIYRGPFNALLHELARHQVLRTLIGTKIPRKRMVDEELILRFFALHAGLDRYRTPLKRFLNDYMGRVRHADAQTLDDFRGLFAQTLRTVAALFASRAFRVTDAQGKPVESTVNRALFDTQMLACSWAKKSVGKQQANKVKRQIAALFSDEDFLDSIQRATGDRSRTLKRLRDTSAALQRAGVKLSIPFDLSK